MLTKKVVTPQAKKACSNAIQLHGISERRACLLVGVNRATVRYKERRIEDGKLSDSIRAIAIEKKRFGYRRIHMVLKKKGFKVNHKKVYRIYQKLGLKVLKRGGRKRAFGIRAVITKTTRVNHKWSLDFVSDALVTGSSIKKNSVANSSR
ncbi:MAG: IS3 family transposase [Parachlamydiaceae bacterium]